MRTFWKGIASVLFYVISAALLIYAASRSLMFIQSTLPPDQAIIGYLALAATSGGMLAWLLVFLYKAEGTGQKITSGLMVGIDLLGEIALFTMDTLLESGNSGMITAMTPEEIRSVILGLSALIAINIMATVAFHLLDNDNLKRMRENAVRDQLQDKALEHIEKAGDELARTLAPQLAEQWRADFEARFSDLSALGLGQVNKAPAPAPARPRLPWVKPTPGSPEQAQPATEAAPAPVPFVMTHPNGNGNGHHPNGNGSKP